MLSPKFKNKKVLITGHTGFKGAWLTQWLTHMGCEVSGFSNGIPTSPSLFENLNLKNKIRDVRGEISDQHALSSLFKDFKPEIVFHLAGQSLVSQGLEFPLETFQTNIMGTASVLECIRKSTSCQAAVIVTSDKCYEPVDPYSASKASAEILVNSYFQSFFKNGGPRVATARSGNLIGGGDWAQDRLIPDCIRAWKKGGPVLLRQPQSTRSWLSVLDGLSGYIKLAEALLNGSVESGAFNFGSSETWTAKAIVENLAKYLPGLKWESQEKSPFKENIYLSLNSKKAQETLNWEPKYSVEDTLKALGKWYKDYHNEGFAGDLVNDLN